MKVSRLSTVFYFALAGIELTYLYLVASLLSKTTYVLVLLLLPYLLAALSKLALPWSALGRRLSLIVEAILVILVILLVVGERVVTGQPEVLNVILRIGFCGLVWFLGHTLPREEVEHSTIAFRFQVGIVALLVFAQVTGNVPAVFIFFPLAALALFLARWRSSLSRRARPLQSPKLRHLLLAGTGAVLPGTALVLLLSPGVAHAIVDWLGGIGTRVSSWVDAQQRAAATTSNDFRFDFGCSARPEGDIMPPEAGFLSPPPPAPPSDGGIVISPVVIWVVVFVIFLAMVALIVFLLRRRGPGRGRPAVEPGHFRTRTVTSGMLHALVSVFRQLLGKVWLWLRRCLGGWGKRGKPTEGALLSVRSLYRDLLRWAARQGVARAPAQTPLEHLRLLEQRFPQWQDGLRQVTEAYLVARYSQQRVSRGQFERAREAWQRTVAHHNRSRFTA